MNKGKNSNDAEPSQSSPSGRDNENAYALSRRIGASASGLLQNSLGPSSPNAVTGTLASRNVGAAKGSSSSSAANRSNSSLSSQSSSSCSTQNISSRSLGAESFRSQPGNGKDSRENGQAGFDEFMLGSGESRQASIFEQNGPLSDEQWPTSHFAAAYLRGVPPAVRHVGAEREPADVEEFLNANSDGAAVVALLSNPDSTLDEDILDSWDMKTREQNGEGHGLPKLLDQPNNLIGPMTPTNPLDLMPDFSSSWRSMSRCRVPADKDDGSNGDCFLDPSFGDIQPWVDILHRYHDEVWGDMLPLVQEARKEAKAVNQGDKGALQDSPAIRRLGMLLKHLDRPNIS
ncbi:hypothetical protein MMC28_000147 [Mycoblastus sanguinarius]|nr:hypothetical protein [Mycoblastus sanguinarius]